MTQVQVCPSAIDAIAQCANVRLRQYEMKTRTSSRAGHGSGVSVALISLKKWCIISFRLVDAGGLDLDGMNSCTNFRRSRKVSLLSNFRQPAQRLLAFR